MANISLDWKPFKFEAAKAQSWTAFKKLVDPDDLNQARDPKSVYVIRICRPFAITYKRYSSPVVYIGRGRFKARIARHLKNWICPLSKQIPSLEIEILTCKPRVRHNGDAFKDVEADLIQKFVNRYGEKPIKNKRLENHHRRHTYSRSSVTKAIGMVSGRGYHWALSPIGSSPLRRV